MSAIITISHTQIFVRDEKAAMAAIKALTGGVVVRSDFVTGKGIRYYPSEHDYDNPLSLSLEIVQDKQLLPCKPGTPVRAEVAALLMGPGRKLKRINGRQQLLLTDGREQ
jgi:hypothetical protein